MLLFSNQMVIWRCRFVRHM